MYTKFIVYEILTVSKANRSYRRYTISNKPSTLFIWEHNLKHISANLAPIMIQVICSKLLPEGWNLSALGEIVLVYNLKLTRREWTNVFARKKKNNIMKILLHCSKTNKCIMRNLSHQKINFIGILIVYCLIIINFPTFL